MIGQSDIRPQAFSVTNLSNGNSEIMFYDNIVEKEVSEFEQELKTVYEFDMYELTVQTRVDLIDNITANYQSWLEFAKGKTLKPLSDKEKIAMLDQVVMELVLGGL